MKDAASFVPFAVVVAAAAFVGSRFMPGPWYASLSKPPWNPPNWVFAPVWTVLYIMIAIAGWLVWRSAGLRSGVVLLWAAQLVLNAIWTWLFFGRRTPGLAFADIILLLASIIAFIMLARTASRAASWLFVPYAAWVMYAASLNLWVWLRKPASAA